MKKNTLFLAAGIAAFLFSPALAGEPAPAVEVNTTDRWISLDEKPFKLRRTLEDFLNPDAASAKGAHIWYTNDFNAHSEQWGFHGVAGFHWHQMKNPDFGGVNGGRLPIDPNKNPGIVERWFSPSVQWDKINTSNGDADEIDSLIFRATTGFIYTLRGPEKKEGSDERKKRLIDGWRVDLSASYATDSDFNTGIAAGELDIKPVGIDWGLNSAMVEERLFHVFRVRPELSFHIEAGTVSDDGGIAALAEQDDFFRVGGSAGISLRFTEDVIKSVPVLEGLLLHAGLQYYADLTDNGPDVDLFTASADWSLDKEGRYTLSVEYRNGRSPLVLERDNRLTVGLGVKF